tara:strand:- start:2349 stop:3287 length:939 start_codon:yes stop_codon:yes gene_type:complete
MGCPDWPKCFGMYIPPTSVSQLPENYKEKFVEGRVEKNKRLSRVLNAIGLNETADKIINDSSIQDAEDFNPFKTWTEYINRLIGAIVGFSLIFIFISSINIKPFNLKLFILSFLSLVLVFFQAWVGSIVVSTNLLSGLITFHVIVALIIICNVILCYYLSSKHSKVEKTSLLSYAIALSLFLFLIQMILGTEVRESVDAFLKVFSFENRSQIIENLGSNFIIHRSFSLLILLLQIFITYLVFIKSKHNKEFKTITFIMLILIISEILVGAGMAYFEIPRILQPIHLLLAFMIVGLQFYIYLHNSNIKKVNSL